MSGLPKKSKAWAKHGRRRILGIAVELNRVQKKPRPKVFASMQELMEKRRD